MNIYLAQCSKAKEKWEMGSGADAEAAKGPERIRASSRFLGSLKIAALTRTARVLVGSGERLGS